MYTGLEHLLTKALEYRWGRILFSSLTAISTMLIAVFAVPHGAHGFMLAVRAATATATVTDTRDVSRHTEFGQSRTYELKYSFELEGQWFVRRGIFGETAGGIWSEVNKAEWTTAAKTKKLEVVYDPADPPNNRPAHSKAWLFASAVSMIFCASGTFAASLHWFGRVIVRDILPAVSGGESRRR